MPWQETFVAHFDHAVRDRVVEADLPEALLRESGARTREISHEIICRLAGPYGLHPRFEGESATGVSCCCLVALEATRWREWSWWHRSAVPGASTPPAASKKPAQHAQVTYRSEARRISRASSLGQLALLQRHIMPQADCGASPGQPRPEHSRASCGPGCGAGHTRAGLVFDVARSPRPSWRGPPCCG